MALAHDMTAARRVADLVVRLPGLRALKRGLVRVRVACGLPPWLVRPAVIGQLGRLRAERVTEGEGPRVVVMSFRGAWLLHGVTEAIFAEALRRRGARPTVFVCSGGLPAALPAGAPACGVSTVHAPRPPDCAACSSCATETARSLRLPWIGLEELVAREQMQELYASVDAIDGDALGSVEHRGLPVGAYAENSARWYLCVSDLGLVPEGEMVLRAFVKSALVIAEAAGPLLDRVRPDVVFMLNGLFFAERILRERARKRGIRVVTYEHGVFPNTLCASDGIANYYDIGDLWEEVRDQDLSPDENAALDDYMAARRRGERASFNYWPNPIEGRQRIASELGLDLRRPVVGLFTNVTWDSAAQGRDRAFEGLSDWVAATILHFARRPGVQLVIRVHPAEVRGVPGHETMDPILGQIRQRFGQLPSNVRIVPPESHLSSYSLAEMSVCDLVYTSTIGLEMAMDGLPVVVAGDVHYAGRGFTIDPKTRDEYGHAVATALQLGRKPETADRARRYAYAFFFRNFHASPFVSENAPSFVPSLTVADRRALDPGRNATLDLLCDRIMRGGPFYAPRGHRVPLRRQ